MKITRLGVDMITLTEIDYENKTTFNHKVHLIKLVFTSPNQQKMDWVIKNFPSTRRFVVSDNVSFYNHCLKQTNLKYYVCNTEPNRIVSFFKRHNKVLLDITCLSETEKVFVLNVALDDILTCTEVIAVRRIDYIKHVELFNGWSGDLILLEEGDVI